MAGPVHLEYEIVAATVDASGTLVARVDAVADPLGMNPILRDLGLPTEYIRLVFTLIRKDAAVADDQRAAVVLSRRLDASAPADVVSAGLAFARRNTAATTDTLVLAFVHRSNGAGVDWARQQVRSMRFDAAAAAERLAVTAAGQRRDQATSKDSGRVVLENYALDYADDYVGEATTF